MFETFSLKNEATQGVFIQGYHWSKEKPDFVVCIIHGIGEHAGRYDRVAEKMQQAGFAVVSMDLRGHGRSSGKRGHCAPREEVRGDVDALLSYGQNMYPGVPVVLYGHSMGGNILLDYRKRGIRNDIPTAYIASAPWVELVRKVPSYQYAFLKALSKIFPQLTISSGVSAKELGNEKTACDYEKDPLVHKRISLQSAAEGFDIGIAMAEGRLSDNKGAEGKPLLLMHGTEDRICSINGSQKIAAAEICDYIQWPGLYHEIHNGGAESTGDEVIERTIRWIRELSV